MKQALHGMIESLKNKESDMSQYGFFGVLYACEMLHTIF